MRILVTSHTHIDLLSHAEGYFSRRGHYPPWKCNLSTLQLVPFAGAKFPKSQCMMSLQIAPAPSFHRGNACCHCHCYFPLLFTPLRFHYDYICCNSTSWSFVSNNQYSNPNIPWTELTPNPKMAKVSHQLLSPGLPPQLIYLLTTPLTWLCRREFHGPCSNRYNSNKNCSWCATHNTWINCHSRIIILITYPPNQNKPQDLPQTIILHPMCPLK